MTEQQRSPDQGERVVYSQQDLAPIEHLIYGSTPDISGTQLDVPTLMKQAQEGDEEAYRLLTTPLYIQEGTRDVAAVNQDRKAEREGQRKHTAGMLPVFSPEGLVDLDDESLLPWFEPPAVDEASGMISPSWRIFIMRNRAEVIDDPLLFQKLQIRERRMNDFHFEPPKPGEVFGILSAHLSPQETIQ